MDKKSKKIKSKEVYPPSDLPDVPFVSQTDVDGSYTGNSTYDEKPVQDADDL